MNGAPDTDAGTRYRTTLVMWGVQLVCLAPLFLLTRLVPREWPPAAGTALLAALAAAALLAFGASFVVRAKLLAEAVARRSAERAQSAYVIAFALCEASALLGIAAHFTTGAGAAVYFFALGALGFALHFPRRMHFDEPPRGTTFGRDA